MADRGFGRSFAETFNRLLPVGAQVGMRAADRLQQQSQFTSNQAFKERQLGLQQQQFEATQAAAAADRRLKAQAAGLAARKQNFELWKDFRTGFRALAPGSVARQEFIKQYAEAAGASPGDSLTKSLVAMGKSLDRADQKQLDDLMVRAARSGMSPAQVWQMHQEDPMGFFKMLTEPQEFSPGTTIAAPAAATPPGEAPEVIGQTPYRPVVGRTPEDIAERKRAELRAKYGEEANQPINRGLKNLIGLDRDISRGEAREQFPNLNVDLEPKEINALNKMKAVSMTGVGTINKFVNQLKADEQMRNAVRLRGIAGFTANVRALAIGLGTVFNQDTTLLDETRYASTFKELGIKSRQAQARIVALAYSRVVSLQGDTQRISDADVRAGIESLGAQARDPDSLITTLSDVSNDIQRGYRNHVVARAGVDPGPIAVTSPREMTDDQLIGAIREIIGGQ